MAYQYVSIVLPVYNAESTLALCLDSLTSLDYPKEKLEIIVVDNNSTDASKEIIKKYAVRYFLEPHKGASVALNTGILNSNGEIVCFTHSDCVVEKSWVKNLVNGFISDNIGGCGGEVLSYNPKTRIEKYCDYRRMYFQNGNIAKDESILPWIMLANAAFRRKALDAVGSFDALFTEEYDIDLSFRVWLKGYKFKYIPEAVVYHKNRDNLISLWRQSFRIGLNSPRFLRKYGKIYETLYILPYKDWLYLFKAVFNSLVSFFGNIFKEKGIRVLFPLFDLLVYSALFFGGIFGSITLHQLTLFYKPGLNNNRPY